jgi:hypothetical protein
MLEKITRASRNLKKLKIEVQHYSERGFKVFYLDEVHFKMMPYLTKGWFVKGG